MFYPSAGKGDVDLPESMSIFYCSSLIRILISFSGEEPLLKESRRSFCFVSHPMYVQFHVHYLSLSLMTLYRFGKCTRWQKPPSGLRKRWTCPRTSTTGISHVVLVFVAASSRRTSLSVSPMRFKSPKLISTVSDHDGKHSLRNLLVAHRHIPKLLLSVIIYSTQSKPFLGRSNGFPTNGPPLLSVLWHSHTQKVLFFLVLLPPSSG